MDRTSIKNLIREVLGAGTELKDQGEWVSTHCPLAPWTHTHGTDRNMSFGIKVNHQDSSIFNCLTCKRKGTLQYLLNTLSYYSGESYDDLTAEVELNEVIGSTPPTWDERHTYDSKNAELGDPVSTDFLDIYDSAVGHWYLQDRGISDEVAKTLGLCYDPDNYGVERILFPVFSEDGGFYGYTGRAVVSDADPRIRDYFGLPKRLLLLGAEFIDTDTDDYIVIVEGLFDYARLFSYGIPVVASMHSGLTPHQARILKNFNLPAYPMYDDDKAGGDGVKLIKEALVKHIPLRRTRYPTEATVWDNTLQAYRPPQDPDELNKEQVFSMLEDYRLL